jgi:hypothetical protein
MGVLVGNARVLAFGIPLPAVEGTCNAIAFDFSAAPQVSAEVVAVSVEHRQFTGLTSKGDQIMAEVLHGFDLARSDFFAPTFWNQPVGFIER